MQFPTNTGRNSSIIRRTLDEIPAAYRSIFADYKDFNAVQSKIFDDVFQNDCPIVVSAPTGSGKTAIFELAIIRLLMNRENLNCGGNFKMIYVAPVKALCTERFTDWRRKFSPLGVNCLEVTGDSDIAEINELEKAKLIITTPEKWDSLTRKWKDNENIVAAVKLFMIDEVHLLNEDGRGPILEAIVSRMKTIQFLLKIKNGENTNLRFVAVSATIPNIEDIAVWLNSNEKTRYWCIADNLRPVKLQKYVLGFQSNLSGFRFDMSLNYKLSGIIRKYSNGKPTLVFCSSRKSAEMASSVLVKQQFSYVLTESKKSELLQILPAIKDIKLHNLIKNGIAYHHAGLCCEDRNVIEDAFRKSLISVLVCTNTLAMGVNLPAHLVVLKSTETYIHGSMVEYTPNCVLQMIGRAGRPQFDVSGVAVIMTQQKYVKKYENLMNGCTSVESHLHKHLAEHLNSEIVLQTITDLDLAMKWIRSTFLYVRAIKCPANYGLEIGMAREHVEKKLEEMCSAQINDLETNGLVTRNQTIGPTIRSTAFGHLMAKFYISFDTMKLFRKVRGDESILEILNILTQCKEFSEFKLRVSDKRTLNELNDQPIRFPIKGKIKSIENKISCLIQGILGNNSMLEPSLIQETFRMVRIAERTSKCLKEYIRLTERTQSEKIFKALLNAVTFAKCVKAKLWENSIFFSRQVKKIGPVYSNLLAKAGKTTFKDLLETDPHTIETILNKSSPFGKEIQDAIATFPYYKLQLNLRNPNTICVNVTQVNEKYKFNGSSAIIIIGDTDNNLLLYHDKVDYILSEHGNFERVLNIKHPGTIAINAHLIHGSIVGVDKTVSLVLRPIEKDDDFEPGSKSKPKRKIQTKLRVNKVARKTPSTNNKDGQKINENDEYTYLFDDDFQYNCDDINNENPVGRSNSSIYDRKQLKRSKTTSVNIQRKISEFVYHDKVKIPKVQGCDFNEIRAAIEDNSIDFVDQSNNESKDDQIAVVENLELNDELECSKIEDKVHNSRTTEISSLIYSFENSFEFHEQRDPNIGENDEMIASGSFIDLTNENINAANETLDESIESYQKDKKPRLNETVTLFPTFRVQEESFCYQSPKDNSDEIKISNTYDSLDSGLQNMSTKFYSNSVYTTMPTQSFQQSHKTPHRSEDSLYSAKNYVLDLSKNSKFIESREISPTVPLTQPLNLKISKDPTNRSFILSDHDSKQIKHVAEINSEPLDLSKYSSHQTTKFEKSSQKSHTTTTRSNLTASQNSLQNIRSSASNNHFISSEKSSKFRLELTKSTSLKESYKREIQSNIKAITKTNEFSFKNTRCLEKSSSNFNSKNTTFFSENHHTRNDDKWENLFKFNTSMFDKTSELEFDKKISAIFDSEECNNQNYSVTKKLKAEIEIWNELKVESFNNIFWDEKENKTHSIDPISPKTNGGNNNDNISQNSNRQNDAALQRNSNWFFMDIEDTDFSSVNNKIPRMD